MSAPDTLIIILHYGKIEDTLETLASLANVDRAKAPFQTLVIDNGSGSDLGSILSAQYPAVRFLGLERNRGFAGGNNVGLELALAEGFDFSLLLNNDVSVAPDFLLELRAALDADPSVAMAGPLSFFHDEPERIWAFGGFISKWNAAVGPKTVRPGRNEPVPTDYLPGACILIRNAALEAVGLMPEKYFLAYEEAEFCLAARRGGFGVVACPRARIWHKVGMSSKATPEYQYNTMRNRFLFGEYLANGGWLWNKAFVLWLFVRFYLSGRRSGKLVWRALRDHFRYSTVRAEHLTAVLPTGASHR